MTQKGALPHPSSDTQTRERDATPWPPPHLRTGPETRTDAEVRGGQSSRSAIRAARGRSSLDAATTTHLVTHLVTQQGQPRCSPNANTPMFTEHSTAVHRQPQTENEAKPPTAGQWKTPLWCSHTTEDPRATTTSRRPPHPGTALTNQTLRGTPDCLFCTSLHTRRHDATAQTQRAGETHL